MDGDLVQEEMGWHQNASTVSPPPSVLDRNRPLTRCQPRASNVEFMIPPFSLGNSGELFSDSGKGPDSRYILCTCRKKQIDVEMSC